MLSDANKIIFITVIIFIIALSIRFFYWSEYSDTSLDEWHLWEVSDMATYIEQSRRIKTEGWLAEKPYHPYLGWQYVASESDWNKWYGQGVFHQAPAYSYFLTALSFVTDEPIRAIKILQFIAGSLSCVLIFLICNYLASLYAASVAGVLSAFYAPMFYLEAHVLREAFAVFSMLFIFYLLIESFSYSSKKNKSILALLIFIMGLALGLFMQLHQVGLILFLTILFFLILRNFMQYKHALAKVSLLTLGFIMGFSPWLLRNIDVGAPLFSVSSRMPIVFVQSNEASAPHGGAFFGEYTASMVEILNAAYEKKENIFVGVLHSYEGDRIQFFKNWWLRFKTVWTSYEIADNTSYYFFMEMVPFLKLMPNFSQIFPLGAAAMLMLLIPIFKILGELIKININKNGSFLYQEKTNLDIEYVHFMLIFWVTILFMSLSMAHSTGRFRIYLVPFFIIYTGVLIDFLINAYFKKNIKFVMAIVSIIVALVLFQKNISNFKHGLPGRPDYMTAYNLAIKTGDVPTLIKVCNNSNNYYPDLLIDLGLVENGNSL